MVLGEERTGGADIVPALYLITIAQRVLNRLVIHLDLLPLCFSALISILPCLASTTSTGKLDHDHIDQIHPLPKAACGTTPLNLGERPPVRHAPDAETAPEVASTVGSKPGEAAPLLDTRTGDCGILSNREIKLSSHHCMPVKSHARFGSLATYAHNGI